MCQIDKKMIIKPVTNPLQTRYNPLQPVTKNSICNGFENKPVTKKSLKMYVFIHQKGGFFIDLERGILRVFFHFPKCNKISFYYPIMKNYFNGKIDSKLPCLLISIDNQPPLNLFRVSMMGNLDHLGNQTRLKLFTFSFLRHFAWFCVILLDFASFL